MALRLKLTGNKLASRGLEKYFTAMAIISKECIISHRNKAKVYTFGKDNLQITTANSIKIQCKDTQESDFHKNNIIRAK